MPQKLTKLAALRPLSDRLEKLEKQHQRRVDRGDNPAEVDRETAQAALNDVVTFFMDHDIESRSLVQLLGGLEALSAGSSAARMITQVLLYNQAAADLLGGTQSFGLGRSLFPFLGARRHQWGENSK